MILEQLNKSQESGGLLAISPLELREKISANSNDLVLLDVREEKELRGELGHIDGITHIPIGALEDRVSELEQYRDQEIVVICRSGARAKKGAKILTAHGFSKVYVLEGGMINWRK